MSLNNSTYTQSLGIPFTQYVTSSAGHALISSSTYFNDTSDNLPRYKDADGTVLVPFVSSSYAVTASYALNGGGSDTNFANTDLTFDGNRNHDTNGNDLFISVDGNFSTATVTNSFLGIQPDETVIGYSSSAFTVYNAGGGFDIKHVGDTVISGSLSATGLTQGAGTNTVAMYDTGSGQFFYTASSVISGDTNFANTDLTFTADRNHDSNGFDFFVTADNGGFNSAYIGYQFQSVMGGPVTQSFLGVQNTYIRAEDEISGKRIVLIADNTSSITVTGGTSNGGVSINGQSLFISTVTGDVSIGKNTSNSKLDVNGNTIITGSLTISNSLNTEGAKVRKYRTITLTDADYSTVPSDKINSDDDIILVINNITAAPGVGEANFGIGSFLASPSGRCVEIVCIKSGSRGILLSDPDMVGLRLYLNDQSQANGFREVCENVGQSITLMSYGLDASGSAWGNGY
jgi:hypothetical protein